jgi:hypothetical protein
MARPNRHFLSAWVLGAIVGSAASHVVAGANINGAIERVAGTVGRVRVAEIHHPRRGDGNAGDWHPHPKGGADFDKRSVRPTIYPSRVLDHWSFAERDRHYYQARSRMAQDTDRYVKRCREILSVKPECPTRPS